MTTHKEERRGLLKALSEFASSDRYNFLKSLQVGPILGDDAHALGSLTEVTFEKLVALGDEDSPQLNELSRAQERVLITMLRALSEGEASEVGARDAAQPTESDERSSEATIPTTFNSIQCEQELRDRILTLKSHPLLSEVKDQQLGRFWDDACMRSPFEEAFTVQQLLGYDLAVLTKKRSMTSTRMHALTRALENALATLDQPKAAAPLSGGALAKSPPIPSTPTFAPHRWQGHYEECSPADMALIESIIGASSFHEGRADAIQGALQHFSAVFTPHEFLNIVKGNAITPATQRKLSAWVHSGALRNVLPIVRMTLHGPGVHVSRVSQLLSEGHRIRAFHGVATILIFRGVGASKVRLSERVCEDVWTSNPGLVPMIMRQATALPKVSLSRAVALVCPDMDPFLHAWLLGAFPRRKRGKNRRGK